jgi:diguanylate cyclase (GGDEF)-like protein
MTTGGAERGSAHEAAESGIEGLRRYARHTLLPRTVGAVVIGLGPVFSPTVLNGPISFACAAGLALSNVLLFVSRRLNDRNARLAIIGVVALDFLSVGAFQFGIYVPSVPSLYMGTIIVGILAVLLFRTRGYLVFAAAFIAVGWLPYEWWRWQGRDVPLTPFLLNIATAIIATGIVAIMAEGSERRRRAAAFLAHLNQAMALVARSVMNAPRRDEVIDTLSDTLPNLNLPWSLGVLTRQPDGSLTGPGGTVVDPQDVRQSWDGATLVVSNPDFLNADRVASICGQMTGTGGDTAFIRCRVDDELVAGIVVVAGEPNAFGEGDMNFFATLGRQVCSALDRAALLEQVEELAVTDVLTQLRNRRAFDERLAEETVRSDRNDQPLALIMLDIDYFKLLNDTQGHPAGDRTLTQIGEILQSPALLRSIDLSYRLGGEEFVVLMPGTDLDGAMVVAERLRALVGETDFPDASEQPLGHLTVSVGVAVHVPGSGDSGTALIEAADLALYEAKRSGRDCVRSAPEVRGVSVKSEAG